MRRGNIDDRALRLPLDHLTCDDLEDVEHSDDADVDRSPEIFLAGRQEILPHTGHGIGHEDVNGTQFRGALGHHPLDGGALADIRLCQDRAAPQRPNGARHLRGCRA